MEYTHIHVHPWTKSKQYNKNKVQYVDSVNKGNQKLYLTVKNKINHKLENKTKGAKWEIKPWKQLINMLRGKKRKERKKE